MESVRESIKGCDNKLRHSFRQGILGSACRRQLGVGIHHEESLKSSASGLA